MNSDRKGSQYERTCFSTVWYKTRSAVGRTHLVHRPRFRYESMFYTQSVMLRSRVIPPSVFYIHSAIRSPDVRSPESAVHKFILTGNLRFWTVLIDTNVACSVRMRDDELLIQKTKTIILFTSRTLVALAWETE